MAKKKSNIIVQNDTISYSGNVKVMLAKGKKILQTLELKNNATQNFLIGIASYFLKQYNSPESNTHLPNLMGIGRSADTSYNPYTSNILRDEINNSRVYATPISGEEEITGGGYKVKYQAVFPYSIIGTNTIKEIGLFGSEQTASMLARVTITNGIEVPAGMSLIVVWSLSIINI